MRRLLVALDGSKRAPLVLEAAAQLAQLSGARLVLFRAIGIPLELPREVLVMQEVRLEEVLTNAARAELTELARAVRPELIERISTEIGTSWDAIVREARKAEADMIVIGSHGYGGLDRLLGTTAAKVVNHADRNVLIVRTLL